MSTITLSGHIPESLAGKRLDQALAKLFSDYSRAQLQNWIKAGQVTVDGKIADQPRQKVHAEQQVTICAKLVADERWEAQPIALDIIFEDADLIVINKPAGLVVHPGAGNPDNTLVQCAITPLSRTQYPPSRGHYSSAR